MRVKGVWRRWAVAAVAVLAAAACSEGTIDAVPTSPAAAPTGNTARFCALWPDARTTLLDTVTGEASFDLLGDETVGLDQLMRRNDTALANAAAAAPATIRSDWDVAYGAYTAASDLLFTVGYTDAVIRPVHFAMAFGDAGHDAAIADATAAVAAIDDWSVETCGDFCIRWPEFEYILRYEPNFDWGIWHDNVDRYLLSLDIGDRLVPDAVKAEWDVAVDIQRRRMIMFRDNDFRLDVDDTTALAEWGVIPPDEAKETSDAALDVVRAWADATCDTAVLTVGAPGTVSVRFPLEPGLGGSTYLVAVLPAGVDFADVRSLDDLIAVSCSDGGGGGPDMRPEDMPAEILSPIEGQGEYFSSNLCHLINREERAVVPGGAHELFVGAFTGGPGAYGLYFAAPEYCVQIPIGVNGNTVVDVPPMEPCDLDPVGSADEVARRTAPPADASGRLQIEIPTALGRSGYQFCVLTAYLLPEGTTLNAIGRGEAWPVASVTMHRGADEIDAGEDRRRLDRPGIVPLLGMPPSGTGEVNVFAASHSDMAWDAWSPDPIPIEDGTYTLWVYEWCAEEGADEEDYWCGESTVDVAGDTTVPLPELGECP